MSSTERELWEGIVDREALGEAPSREERLQRDSVARRDIACSAESDVYRVLGGALAGATAKAPADDRLIQTALRATADETPAAARQAPRKWQTPAAIAAAAALLLGVGAFMTMREPATGSSAKAVNTQATPLRPQAPSVTVAAERTVRIAQVEGSVLVNGATPRASDTVMLGSRVKTGTGRACLAFERDVVACVGPGSEVRVTALGKQQELELSKGHLVAVLKGQPAGSHFAISTGSGVVTAVGTVFALEVASNGSTTLRVAEGSVAARTQGAERLVRPGEELLLGSNDPALANSADVDRDRALVEPVAAFAPALGQRAALAYAADQRAVSASPVEPERVERSPAALLELASKARSRGGYAEAARHYERLLSAHADSPEGRAALIGLAEVRLSRLGEPARALGLFERYLASGGSLAQEAHYGKIQALRALGRTAETEREALSFLELYPKSAYAGSLRKLP
jgi:hypothetical protein